MPDVYLSPYACPHCEALSLPTAEDVTGQHDHARCPVCGGYVQLLVSEDAQGNALGAVWAKEEQTYGLDG